MHHLLKGLALLFFFPPCILIAKDISFIYELVLDVNGHVSHTEGVRGRLLPQGKEY